MKKYGQAMILKWWYVVITKASVYFYALYLSMIKKEVSGEGFNNKC